MQKQTNKIKITRNDQKNTTENSTNMRIVIWYHHNTIIINNFQKCMNFTLSIKNFVKIERMDELYFVDKSDIIFHKRKQNVEFRRFNFTNTTGFRKFNH